MRCCRERPMCRSAFVIKYLLIYNIIPNASYTPKKCDSRSLQKNAPPKMTKTSPKSTRPIQSETILRSVKAGALGGSSGKVREVWRVGNPLRKRVSCASKVFLFSKVFPFLPPPHPNVSTQKSESSARRRTVTSSRSSPSAAPTCRLSQRRLPSRRKPRPA